MGGYVHILVKNTDWKKLRWRMTKSSTRAKRLEKGFSNYDIKHAQACLSQYLE